MHHHYRDIRDRLGEPSWWDECAVPRYCEFGPDETANIYARQVVLLLIECQSCGTEFRVAMTCHPLDDASLAELIARDEIHYGDPPNVDCCAAGPTMNSIPRRVLEFWDRDPRAEAQRRPELERDIAPDWAQDDDQDDKRVSDA